MGTDKENRGEKKLVNTPVQNYEITSQGSLGLLALGAAGIRAWREKREEEKTNIKPGASNE
ncbi:MAG TPA: hypothetical protein VF868_14085 [Bacteroidia bacterium]